MATANRQKAPEIHRPTIRKWSSEETWNAFLKRWEMFRHGTELTTGRRVQQLFMCCEDELGNEILNSYPNAVSDDEQYLLTAIKTVAVTPVAVSVRRSEPRSYRDHKVILHPYKWQSHHLCLCSRLSTENIFH